MHGAEEKALQEKCPVDSTEYKEALLNFLKSCKKPSNVEESEASW